MNTKQFILITILVVGISVTTLTIRTYGQTQKPENEMVVRSISQADIEYDTIQKVSYQHTDIFERNPAYFINDLFINRPTFYAIDPNLIQGINIVNEDIEIDHKKYYGQIYLEMKPIYQPKFISINDLKLKYADLQNIPVIIMVDNQVVHDNYDCFFIDQRSVQKIIIEKIDNSEQHLLFNLVKIVTKPKDKIVKKTEEDNNKPKEIRIRGAKEFEG